MGDNLTGYRPVGGHQHGQPRTQLRRRDIEREGRHQRWNHHRYRRRRQAGRCRPSRDPGGCSVDNRVTEETKKAVKSAMKHANLI